MQTLCFLPSDGLLVAQGGNSFPSQAAPGIHIHAIPDLCWDGPAVLGQDGRWGLGMSAGKVSSLRVRFALVAWWQCCHGQDLLRGSSVAVLTAGVAGDSIQPAAAAPTGIPNALISRGRREL